MTGDLRARMERAAAKGRVADLAAELDVEPLWLVEQVVTALGLNHLVDATDRPLPARDELAAVLPPVSTSSDVREWPEDERDLYRNGFPEQWTDWTSRGAALDLLRRRKAADAVLALLTNTRAPIDAQEDQ